MIESLTAQQRVYEHIELRGSGFGEINDPDDPCVHQVVFSGDDVEITVENVYVWRDDYIRVRVPVGATIDGSAVPIPKTPLLVSVRTSAGTSDPLPFQVITSAGTVAFLERTNIANSNDGDPTNDEDISTFLGDPPMNLAQTKDGEIGDFDNDGRLDIFDANSGNVRNETYPLIRYGRDSDGFDAFPFERRLNGEPGTFLLATNDVYIQDAITYDLDAMDLNNDLFLDLVQATQEDTGSYFRVFIRRADDPRRYDEQTFTWMGTEPFGPGRPDDLDHIDADRDGFVDLVATLRFNGEVGAVRFFHNNSGESFDDWVSVSEEFNGQSVHDAFFVFANSDALPDIGFCSEVIKSCAVSINTGDGLFAPPSEFGPSPMITGAVGDFNGDGIEDLTVAGGIGQFG
ncbi:MAG: hypothetical protein KC636_37195, partial [Myxococcales bacterium]|nr:hypothetical protein [Myxococcales bacterium]